MMNEKLLTKLLQELHVFKVADAQLEQYPTPPAVAAEVLIQHKEHIVNKEILDIGAGTGILGIGALLLGAKKVTFIEKDAEAVKVLEKNLRYVNEEYEVGEYHVIHAPLNLTDKHADTAIMNPPFGTREAHTDTAFLDYACTHTDIIISMHKTSTKEHIHGHIKHLHKKILAERDIHFTLKNTMGHHQKPKEHIEVTVFTIQ